MAKSTEHNLTLTATDRASRPVYQMYQKLKREGKALTNNERQRKMLGIRGEREIQAEILRTQRAYHQLARSGKLSSEQLARAKNAELKKLRELNAEMGKSERLSNGQRFMRGAKVVGAIGASLYTASNLAMNPINQRMDYERSVRGLTKVAYADEGLDGMKAGEEHIMSIIEKNVTDLGATIDQVMQAMDGAFRAGLEIEEVEKILPDVLKASIGSASDPDLIARMVASLLSNGFKPEAIGKSLDQAAKSGDLGGFELADMAESFPEILSVSMGKGFTNEQLPQILAALQVLTKTSGSTSAATTQYKALLSEFNQSNFAERVAKAKYIDPKDGKTKSIDWTGSLAKAAKDGKTPIEAAIGVMEDIMNSDKGLRKAREDLKSNDATVKDKAASKILESSILSNVFGRDLSLQAMLGFLQQKDEFKRQVSGTFDSNGIVDKNYQYESQSTEAKAQSFKDQYELRQIENAKALANTYGVLSEVLTNYMKEYPELTKNLILFGDSLKIVMAALAIGAVTSKLGGWMSGGKGVPGAGGSTSPKAGAATGGGSKLLGSVVRGANVVALADIAGSGYNDPNVADSVKKKNAEVQPFIDEYVQKEGGLEKTRAAYKKFGPWGWHTDNSWQNADPVNLKKYIDQYENDLKQEEAKKNVRRMIDEQSERTNRWKKTASTSDNNKEQSVDEQNEETNHLEKTPNASANNEPLSMSGIDPMSFANNIIAMSQAINALNPLADLPRQLELLQNAKPQEIVLTIPVSVDGRVMYETVERIAINQINRGIA